MKLADWLAANQIGHQEFGDMLGNFGDRVPRSQATVSRWAADKRMPDKDDLLKIFEATNGDVTPNDFVDLPDLGQGADDDVEEADAIPESSIA